MGTATSFNALLAAVGGISGLAVLAYFVIMVYYARQKDRDVQELRREVAQIMGKLDGFMLAARGFDGPIGGDEDEPDHEHRDRVKTYGGIG